MKVTLTLVAILLLIGGGYFALACASQRSVLFPRPPVPADSQADRIPGLEKLAVGASADVEAWYLPPLGAAGQPSGALLFTHGNGELIDFWAAAFRPVREWGIGVLLVEYPGYGRSKGKPSQASITDAVTSAYDQLAARPDVDAARIVAYGRSVGGGAACALAARRDLAALILESSFTGVRPLARRLGLPGFLVLDPFDNLDVVRSFEQPVLIIHGERDEIIPVQHAHELDAAAADSSLHLLPCGHNDCPRPWPLIHAFLGEHAIL